MIPFSRPLEPQDREEARNLVCGILEGATGLPCAINDPIIDGILSTAESRGCSLSAIRLWASDCARLHLSGGDESFEAWLDRLGFL